MNCNKCNNILPDTAKFCPYCGTKVLREESAAPVAAPEPVKKHVCEKCGLEVPEEANFCFVCGGKAIMQEMSPADSSDNLKGTVSLDKPTNADGPVSAINSEANTVPIPSAAVPTPSSYNEPAAPVGQFTPVGQFAPAAAFAPSANAADTSGNSPNAGTLPNYNGAAVAEKPVKKKHKGRIALIIIGVAAALLGAVTILFFTNRAAVLSTVLGKSKYAAVVEGNHIKKVTEQMDMDALADGIKAGSSALQMIGASNIYGINNNYYFADTVTAQTAPMMAAMPVIGGAGADEIDLVSIEKMLAERIAETYGRSNITATLSADITLGDALRNNMRSYQLEELDEILDYINGNTFTYSITTADNALAVSAGSEGKYNIDAKVLLNGQDMYISLPFVSNKAIKLTFDMPANDYNSFNVKPLELDAKELERIVGDIVEIYLEHYKDLDVVMEKGEITAGGVTASGQLITAEFSVKDIYELTADIGKYLAENDYLAETIVTFVNDNSGSMIDEDDYYNAIMDLIETLEDYDEDSKDKLIVETVINNKGDVLAKTYTVVANKVKSSVSFAETKEQSAVEIKGSGVKMSILNEKENDQNGVCTFKLTEERTSLTLALKYSDVQKTEFCGKEILTGKFDLSMKLPDDFKYMLSSDAYAAMNGSKLSIYISSNDFDSLETSVSLTSNGFINASLTETVNVTNETSDLNPPSDSIDVTPLTKGDYIDDESANELTELVKNVITKLNDMGIRLPNDTDILDELDPSALTGKVSKDDIDALTEKIDEYAEMLADLGFDSMGNKLAALSNRIKAKNYNINQTEYSEFSDEFDDIYGELDPTMLAKASVYDINTLTDSIDSLFTNINEYADYYDFDGDYLDGINSITDRLAALSNKIKSKNYNITQSEYSAFENEFYDLYDEWWNY